MPEMGLRLDELEMYKVAMEIGDIVCPLTNMTDVTDMTSLL